MAQLFTPPFQQTLDSNANAISGARLYFYISGTSTPAQVFADGKLTVPLQSPVIADAAGRFVPIYLDPAVAYRVVVADAAGMPIRDVDPVSSGDSFGQDLASGNGSSLVGFSHTSAAASGTVANRLKRFVVATDAPWLAKGDGVADDAAAIQAALDYVGANGGGEVALPLSLGGRYRVTQGLKMPSYTALVGSGPARYPFNAGNTNSSAILADFVDPLQWTIEPKTTKTGGGPYAYNEMVTGALPAGATYNCAVRNLTLTSVGAMPYGGIRMHGCPGSVVDNVAINRVGCGLLVNFSFGGSYSVHTLTPYYGVVAWDDANANEFLVYCAQGDPYPAVVPAAYLMPFMSSLNGTLTSSHKLATNAHYNRPEGLIVGSLSSTSNNNTFAGTVERFGTGVFMLYAYGADFSRLYLESAVNQMLYGIVAARSTFTIGAGHFYLSGTGAAFDLGQDAGAFVRLNGSVFTNFGQVSADAAYLRLEGVTDDQFGPVAPQYNVTYASVGLFKALTLQNSWANAGQYASPAYRHEGQRCFLRGAVAGGANGSTIAMIPAGLRPSELTPFDVFDVAPDGRIIAKTGAAIALSGASWEVGR